MRRTDMTERPWYVTHPDGTKLAGPMMHPDTPPEVRVKVFEYVLTRQYGLAMMIADNARDVIDHKRHLVDLLGLMSEDPYRHDRRAA